MRIWERFSFLRMSQIVSFTYCIQLGTTTISHYFPVNTLYWTLILFVEPWQTLFWVDALWDVLTGKVTVFTLCTFSHRPIPMQFPHASFFIFQYYSFQTSKQPVKSFTAVQESMSCFSSTISLFTQSGWPDVIPQTLPISRIFLHCSFSRPSLSKTIVQ